MNRFEQGERGGLLIDVSFNQTKDQVG